MLIDLDDVCRTVGLVLGHRDAGPDHRILEDLAGESIDVLNIIVTLEQKYHVSVDETEVAKVSTVRDLYHLLQKSPDVAIRPKEAGRLA
jgi:acyl carrier protein